MRDLSTNDKQELSKLQKQNDKMSTDTTSLRKEKERLQQEVADLQNQQIDLKDQVDTCLCIQFTREEKVSMCVPCDISVRQHCKVAIILSASRNHPDMK